MKTRNIFIGLILLMMGLSSCENWFDVSPKTDIKADELFQSEEGFRDVLTGVYALMTQEQSYGRQMTFGYLDVLARYYDKVVSADHEYGKTMDYKYEEPSERGVIESIWSIHYKAIANLNTFLHYAEINKTAFNTETVRCLYTGEAYALRAFLHFDLLRLFAPSPALGLDRKAIPYMEEFTNIASPRLTSAQVLEKVVRDIEAARELMRDYDSYGPGYEELYPKYQHDKQLRNRHLHMNYYAVTALLARVQLYAGNKTEALKAAKEIIGEPGAYPVKPFRLANDANVADPLFKDELIFSLDIPNLADVISPYFGKTAAETGVTNSRKILAFSSSSKNTLFAPLNPSDNDFRLQSWSGETGSSNAQMSGKFEHQRVMPMIRISELYYIAAECAEGSDARTYLNTIRTHRGLAPMESGNVFRELYREYCREFMNEGQMFFYFKRNNMSPMGVNQMVEIDADNVYVFPLPIREEDFGNKN